jgi:hypothetical protein
MFNLSYHLGTYWGLSLKQNTAVVVQAQFELVVARIRDSSNPYSNLNANFAGEREDSNPKVLIQIFSKICLISYDLLFLSI